MSLYDLDPYEPGQVEHPDAPPPAPPKPEPRRSLLLRRLSWRDVLLVVLVIVVLRLWVVETVIVDGASMSPTLLPDEWVLVLKPLSPHRFSVVVFNDPEERETVIKRVVGLPQDAVGGVPIARPQQEGALPFRESRLEVNGTVYNEPYAPSTFGNIRATTVPEGEYYVLGDNRDVSVDSRRYGPVAASSVRGVAVAVVYPFSHMRRISSSTAEPIPGPAQ